MKFSPLALVAGVVLLLSAGAALAVPTVVLTNVNMRAGPGTTFEALTLIPSGTADYSSGQYNIVSGTAWPANAIPSTAQGEEVQVIRHGISRCVASSAVSRGDELNIADNQGRVKTVSESAGTLVYVVGFAEDAASAAGDVIRVLVSPYNKKT